MLFMILSRYWFYPLSHIIRWECCHLFIIVTSRVILYESILPIYIILVFFSNYCFLEHLFLLLMFFKCILSQFTYFFSIFVLHIWAFKVFAGVSATKRPSIWVMFVPFVCQFSASSTRNVLPAGECYYLSNSLCFIFFLWFLQYKLVYMIDLHLNSCSKLIERLISLKQNTARKNMVIKYIWVIYVW